MGTFERYFAEVPLTPQRFPRAPARELADTGQGVEAAALAELGRGLTGTAAVLFKWDQREGNSQYDTARGDAQNLTGEFERTTFADSLEHDAAFKKLEADIVKLAPKNKSGARKFGAWTKLNKASLDKLSAEKKVRMIARNGQVALFQNLTNVLRDYTDPIAAKKRINTLVLGALEDKLIKTAAQAMAIKDRFTEDWLRADVWRRSTATVRPDGEVDWQAAADWYDVEENITDLPENIVEDFANTARANARAQSAEDTEAIRNEQEAQRLEIVKELRPGGDMKKAAKLVKASKLPAAEQADWDRKIEARAAAINGGKDDPMNQTNPAKYFELRRKIETEPGGVTEADLAAAVGEGISIDNYETLLPMVKDKDNPLNAPQAKRSQALIARLRASALKLAEEDEDIDPREIEFNVLAIQNEFDAYLLSEEGRKATDQQKEEKLRALTEPVAEEITLNWFEKLLPTFKIVPWSLTEQKQLVKKKIKELKNKGAWQKLSEEDRESARRAFERGGTVQEVIDKL